MRYLQYENDGKICTSYWRANEYVNARLGNGHVAISNTKHIASMLAFSLC